MLLTIRVVDEVADGTQSEPFALSFLTAQITVRGLVRKRVYEEVQDHNRSMPEHFRGLVAPVEAERVLNLVSDSTIKDPTIVRQLRAM